MRLHCEEGNGIMFPHRRRTMTREEFQNHAMLFHILMDLEDYLKAKKKFVEGLDETQLKMYCNKA